MRHRYSNAKMNRDTSARKALALGLARGLFLSGKIITALEKAKFARPIVEKFITRARVSDLAARRILLKDLRDKELVSHLLDNVAPLFKDRKGGYTRIQRTKNRLGDNAQLVNFSLVEDLKIKNNKIKLDKKVEKKVLTENKKPVKTKEPKVVDADVVEKKNTKTNSKKVSKKDI